MKSNEKIVKRVGVLLAAYNGATWIGMQVNSILQQDSVDVKILIGDDKSSDATAKVLTESFSNDNRVTLIRREMGTGSSGANFRTLYREAEVNDVDYVALSDQDDYWNVDKLSCALASLNGSESDAYSAAVLATWSVDRKKILRQNPNMRAADHLFEGAGQGCTFVMRADFFREVQAFCRLHAAVVEELHHHDWLVYILARAWNKKWCFDARPSMMYRQHGHNELGARDGLSAIRHRLAMIRNGWYARQIQAASRIYILAGGSDKACLVLAKQFSDHIQKASMTRRLSLCIAVLLHGRRRFVDRGILAVAALAAWI